MQLIAGTTTPSSNSWHTKGESPVVCASDGGGCKGGVTVANGLVYFADNGTLYARNAATKEQRWSYAVGVGINNTTPVVANGVLYFGRKAFSVAGISPRARLTASNLAPGSVTSQSGIQFSPYGDPALAVDENVDPDYYNHSVIHTSNQGSTFGPFSGGAYWQIDTPDANNVTQIVIYNRMDNGAPGGLGGFRILYRIGSTWTMAANYTNYVTTTANPVITVPVNISNPDSIVIQKTAQPGYLTVAEVRVLGN
jgi:outer membrane protein assembly factor BamB